MIKLDAIINDKKLLDSIQKGVNQFNRSKAGKTKLNLKINEKGFRQPLGRITGDLDKFESALAASNARVIAFGASTAVIGGITKAFKALAVTTTTVQKHFADINRILNVSSGQFEKFSNELFNIGKKTATSFEDSSKAALEFARQGLGLNETLKRTADALTLVRLTGVSADKAVSALTATVNAFKTQSISTSDALNKFVAVETKFAVSARDLMDALGRVGSAAIDAKVDFNELNAMVAAVQQQTGRGGAVIGNALKTIFTRIQRKDTLKALEDYGIAVRDVEGATLPAMNILKQFAGTYKTLTDSNKAYLREQVAGVFQANILSAVVKDLNSNTQVYGSALKTSIGATNEANTANARLNRTLSAMISQTGTELTRFGENVGKITLEPIAKAMLGPLKGVVEGINNLLDGEGTGSEFANGFLKGIRNIIAGPGMVAAIAIIGTTFIKTLSYITKALPTIVGITTETQKRAKLEATITAMLQTDAGLAKQIAAAEGNAAKQAGLLLGAAQKTATAFTTQEASVTNMARMLATIGMTTNKMGAITPATGRGAFGRGAGGYIPGVSGELHDIHKGVGGVSPSARPVHIPNFAFGGGQRGSMIANTGEHIVPNFSGGGSAIFNPAMVRANGGLPQGAKKITAAQGYVPNFAAPAAYAAGMQIINAGKTGGSLAGWNTHRDTLLAAGQNSYAKKLQGARDKIQNKRGTAATKAKTKDIYSVPASQVGIGALTGYQTGADTQSPRSSFAVLLASKDTGKVADPTLLKFMQAHKNKSLQIAKLPVAGINKANQGQTEDDLERHFSSKLNDFMLPALNDYSASIFKSVLGDDGKSFVQRLKDNKDRVFSASTEGGIFESAISLASRNSKAFGGNDSARFDFEESGHMSGVLKDTFFADYPWMTRADAKRSDKSENIRSLIGKSLGTPETAKSIKAFMAGDISAWQKQRRTRAKAGRAAAGGYIPNFAGGGLGAAIGREKAAGVPSSSIRIHSSPRFQGPSNPAGLAVTNKIDEPGGLRDVPNFAGEGFGSGRRGSATGPAVMMYNDKIAAGRKNANMLASEQLKLIKATREQIVTAIGSGLTAKQLMAAEKQLIAETKKSAGYKRMSGASQKAYIVALKQETAQLNASVPGAAAGGGGMMGGKGMMAGMGLMMAGPMLGGAIEQSVGGKTGAAGSGVLTGMSTGAGMGMMFGPWGVAIGAVVGGLGGLAASLYATRETFESLVEDAEEVGAALKGNQDAVEAYKKAITAQNEATAGTKEHIKATREARQSLMAIADPNLRSAVLKTKDNFEELNKEMAAHTKFESEKEAGLELKALLLDMVDRVSISGEKTTKVEMMATDPGGGNTGTGKFLDVKTAFMTADDIADNARLLFGDIMKSAVAGGAKAKNVQLATDSTQWADVKKRMGSGDKGSKDQIGSLISGLKLEGHSRDALAEILDGSAKAREIWMKGGGALYKSEVKAAEKAKDESDEKTKVANDLLKTRLEELRAYKKRIIEMRKGNESEKRRTKMNNALISFQTSLFKKTGQSETSLAAMTSGGVSAAAEQRRGSLASEFVVAQEKGIKALLDGLELTAKTDRDFMREQILDKLGRGDVGGAITGIRGVQGLKNRSTDPVTGLLTGPLKDSVQKTADIEKLNDYANTLEENFGKQSMNLEQELKFLGLKDKQNVISAARVEREADIARQMTVMAAVSKTGLDARSQDLSAARTQESLFFQDPMNLVGMSNVQVAQRKKTGGLGLLDQEQKLERDRQTTKQNQEIIKALAGAEVNRLTRDLIAKEVELIQTLKENTAALRGETPGATPATTTVFSGEQFVVPPKKPAASKVEPNPYAGIGRRNAFNLVSDPADFGPSGARSPQYTVSPDIAAQGAKFLEDMGIPPLGIQGAVGNIFEPTSLQAPTVGQKIEKAITKKKQQGKAATSPLAAATSKAAKTTLPEIDVSKLDKDSIAILASLDPEKDKQTLDIITKMIALHQQENEQLDKKLKTNRANTEATEAQAVALQKQRTGGGAFKRGVDLSTDKIAKETDEIFYVLGEQLPMQFRDNMVGAIGAAMDKTSSLGDALDGVALAFLSTMRQAFLQSAVGNMMSAGKELWKGVSGNQKGGLIRAQNGSFVGGNSTGDKHPALLESGEYVLNRNAVGALGGPDALNSINFGMAPRFQEGGGHKMSLSENIPSSRFSGLFLKNSNPEYDEYADAASAKQQKAMEKYQKKQQKKGMIKSMLMSAVLSAGMGALSKGVSKGVSKWRTKRAGSHKALWSRSGHVKGSVPGDFGFVEDQSPTWPTGQKGGFISRQSGGSIGSGIARRYGSFQGGGTVPVASGAPSLGSSTNTNNISINIGLGGDNASAGSGASQTAVGNTGAPSKASTADAKALSAKIKSQVLKILTEEQRVGGTLSPTARRA
jgi:TP901 family phage tail tape measure protein